MNPYETLGVPKTATKKQIESAFRKLARKTHPDVGGDAEQFKAVHFAYKLLMDDARRARYDETGTVDDGRPDDSQIRMLNLLTHYFTLAMQRILKAQQRPTILDLVGQMKAEVGERTTEISRQQKEIKKGRQDLVDLQGRFTIEKSDETEENLLDTMVKEQLDGLDKYAMQLASEAKILASALKYLARCKFRSDAPAHAGMFFGIVASTTT